MSGIEGPGVIGGGSGGGIPTTAEVITADDETATLPNSRQILGGTNITLDSATPGELTINTTAQGSTVPATSQGDTLYASAANTLIALAKNASATRYIANTGTTNNPAWSQVDLTNGVTGTLPVGNGGTGLASGTANAVPYFSGTTTIATNAALSFNGTSTLTLGDSTSGTFIPPAAASVTSLGSTMNIRGGPGGGTSGNGGVLSLASGTPTDGNGGNLNITTPDGVSLTATNRTGGTITILAGNGNLGGQGGPASFKAGNGGATGVGGNILITGGLGGATSGTGGSCTLGGGSATDGNGGSITLSAANGTGTNRNGGIIQLIAGTATGSGTAGSLTLGNLTTTGAQTATFTATNKPGGGTTTPSLWLRCVVGATTYYIPMWQ